MSRSKTTFSLEQNIQRFINDRGFYRMGFLTLTFVDNVSDHREASRRFDSLNTNFISQRFGGYILVRERQKRGAWHYHLLLDTLTDLTGGVWAKVKNRKGRFVWVYRHNNLKLRKIWEILRDVLPLYGFGRAELLPLRTSAEKVGKYLGKYIGKSMAEKTKGDAKVKLISYSQNVKRQVVGAFAWVGEKHARLRKDVSCLARMVYGIYHYEDIASHVGPHWAYELFTVARHWREMMSVNAFNAQLSELSHLPKTFVSSDGCLLYCSSGEIIF